MIVDMTLEAKQVKKIIEDTDKLISLAEEGEWDALQELEKSRAILIDEFFKQKPSSKPEKLASFIQYLLDKNQILKQFSLSQRDSIAMELSKANRGHKAVKSYLETA